MTKAMKMLDEFRKFASVRNEYPGNCLPAIFGLPIDVYLGDVIKLLKEEDASIERIVRDAVAGYEELYARAPNDEAEREVIGRTEMANRWLVDHGFEPEKFILSKEEVPC